MMRRLHHNEVTPRAMHFGAIHYSGYKLFNAMNTNYFDVASL